MTTPALCVWTGPLQPRESPCRQAATRRAGQSERRAPASGFPPQENEVSNGSVTNTRRAVAYAFLQSRIRYGTRRMATFHIGITGHRHLGDAADWVADTLRTCLHDLQTEHGPDVAAYSASAIGSDTLFAEAALELDMRLEAVIPFEQYSHDFMPGPDRDRFDHLLARAAAVHALPHTIRSHKAYLAAGKWIVDESDLLLAVHDGRPPNPTKGGTAEAVDYASRSRRRICLINPVTRAVRTA